MSLTHDDYTYLDCPHGMIVPQTEFDLPLVVGQFFGVAGESHIIGEPTGRILSCRLTLEGFADIEAFQTAVNELDNKIGKLTGTLELTISTKTLTYPKCTFINYQTLGEMFLDGSGAHGWCQFINLIWRQRSIA